MRKWTAGLFMACWVIGYTVTAYAQEPARGFGWSDEPFYWTWDHAAYTQGTTALEDRGMAQKVVYGSLATLTLGVNKFELGLMSLGVGAASSGPDEPSKFTGQLGFVPVCGPNRAVCGDVSYARSANDHNITYLFSVLFRLSTLVGSTR